MKIKELWTVTEIAEHLNEPRHRVQYVIDTRDIQYICKMGNSRIYTTKDRDYIGSEIAAMGQA